MTLSCLWTNRSRTAATSALSGAPRGRSRCITWTQIRRESVLSEEGSVTQTVYQASPEEVLAVPLVLLGLRVALVPVALFAQVAELALVGPAPAAVRMVESKPEAVQRVWASAVAELREPHQHF